MNRLSVQMSLFCVMLYGDGQVKRPPGVCAQACGRACGPFGVSAIAHVCEWERLLGCSRLSAIRGSCCTRFAARNVILLDSVQLCTLHGNTVYDFSSLSTLKSQEVRGKRQAARGVEP